LKEFGLSGSEKIKRKKDFELIYNTGKILHSADRKLKAVFIELKDGFEHLPLTDSSDEDINIDKECMSAAAIAAAVSKKAGNAVWRNRIKRLVRESYRLNKKILLKKRLLIVFSPLQLNQKKNGKIYLKDLMPSVIDLLNKINSSK
jgi:ribonuclease P protein component